MKINRKALIANIIACFVYLTISVILTLCGCDFLNSGDKVTSLLTISQFLETHLFLKIIVVCLTSLVLNSLALLTMFKQKTFTKIQFLVFVPLMVIMSVSSWFSVVLNIICNILFIITPMLFLKKKFYRTVIVVGLVAIFQQGLLYIRNIGNWYINAQTTVYASTTLQIDMFVVMLICYLYSIRKETK